MLPVKSKKNQILFHMQREYFAELCKIHLKFRKVPGFLQICLWSIVCHFSMKNRQFCKNHSIPLKTLNFSNSENIQNVSYGFL